VPTLGIVRRSAYFDSVALMLAQREARGLPGVEEVGLVMATDANKALLRESGLEFPDLASAGPDDLAVVARAASVEQAQAALALAHEALTRRRATTSGEAYRPKTIASAVRQLPEATVAVISVPGRFARPVVREALDAGFANRVRPGRIGLVAAAGTGLQEVTSLIHRFGGGITHAIGTGGRDLSAAVGGVTMLQGLRALSLDLETDVIVLISKPPAGEVASQVVAAAAACGKPVIVTFIGATVQATGAVESAATLEEAAQKAVRRAYGIAVEAGTLRSLPAQEAGRLAPGQQYLRGLYGGGTLCYEALVLLRRHVGAVYSNTPLHPDDALDPVTRSRAHTVIDMGGDEFTQGRLHPMLDPTLRLQRIRQEAADPQTAVLLLDLVLGYGAHPEPAAALTPVIREVREQVRRAGRHLSVVASVCGTDGDPQDAGAQRDTLIEAGVLVEDSNARAVRLAGLISEAHGARGMPLEPKTISAAPAAPPWPDVDPITRLLRTPPAVVNVGLELFAESLQAQNVPLVSVDWQPPAGGKQHLLDLLDKLEA